MSSGEIQYIRLTWSWASLLNDGFEICSIFTIGKSAMLMAMILRISKASEINVLEKLLHGVWSLPSNNRKI